MSDLDDYRLDETPSPDTAAAPSPEGGGPSPPRRGWLWALLAVVVLAVIAWLVWGWLQPAPPEVAEQPVVTQEPVAPPAAEPPPEEEIELPPLDASDRLVAELAGELSARPELAAWLANENLVRRFTAAVDNIAEGVSPRPHLGFLAPGSGFQVDDDAAEPRIDPSSFDRYDPLVGVLVSLDVDGTVSLYRRLEPLVDQAYRDLGYPQRDFDATLIAAIDHLLATPVPPESPELVPAVKGYHYADPQLEELSAAQKHLLRMGPDNVRRVQAKLRALRRAL